MPHLRRKAPLFVFLTLLILGAVPAIAKAQELWQGASAGMTPDQVAAAIPQATRPDHPITAKNGDEESLTISSAKVGGQPADVSFWFHEGRLDLVIVNYPIQIAGVTNPIVKKNLITKYGEPSDCNYREDGYTCNWHLGSGLAIQEASSAFFVLTLYFKDKTGSFKP